MGLSPKISRPQYHGVQLEQLRFDCSDLCTRAFDISMLDYLHLMLTGIRCQSEILQISLSAGTAGSAYPWSCAFPSFLEPRTNAWKMGSKVWRDDDIASGWNENGVS